MFMYLLTKDKFNLKSKTVVKNLVIRVINQQNIKMNYTVAYLTLNETMET